LGGRDKDTLGRGHITGNIFLPKSMTDLIGGRGRGRGII